MDSELLTHLHIHCSILIFMRGERSVYTRAFVMNRVKKHPELKNQTGLMFRAESSASPPLSCTYNVKV